MTSEMLDLSHNEAAALAFKAARGAGLDWGMAEEARFAVEWLNLSGLGGLRQLNACLTGRGNDEICVLHAGVALADNGALPQDGIAWGRLDAPLILLPFLAGLSGSHKVEARAFYAIVQQGGVEILTGQQMLVAEDFRVTAASAQSQPFAKVSPEPRVLVEAQIVESLTAFAARTYAPATEASRRLGAGGADD